jgi:hypothetical protein
MELLKLFRGIAEGVRREDDQSGSWQLGDVAQGLAETSQSVGTGHGKHARTRYISLDMQVAVGAAATLGDDSS